MSNFGPCLQDCPNRKAGCSASCAAWQAEKEKRLKVYDKRVERSNLAQKTAGGSQTQNIEGGIICDEKADAAKGGNGRDMRWAI